MFEAGSDLNLWAIDVWERSFFRDVDEASPIRQGDIIRTRPPADKNPDELPPEWGVIVTADCDIAQGKIGGSYTYLSIVSAQTYVKYIWASDELEKLHSKSGEDAINLIHAADIKRNPNVDRLTFAQLSEWLSESGSSRILDAVGIAKGKALQHAQKALDVFALRA